jgi:hypothetical protein
MTARAAVWFWQHGSVYVDVGDTDETIAATLYSEDYGERSAWCVQYEDGTVNLWRDDPNVQRVEQALRQAEKERAAAYVPQPPKPKRTIKAPLPLRDGRTTSIKVDADTPSWVGVP